MSSNSNSAELLSLVEATKEHLSFLRELGVETFAAENKSVDGVLSGEAKPIPAAPPQRMETHVIPKPPATTTVKSHEPALPPEARTDPGGTTLFGDISQPLPALPQSNECFDDIHNEIGNCMRCPLFERRINVVHTEGNRKARLMFVGEAPGADEDEQARPFVGRAGQLLTKIIEAIGLRREDVLIGNVNRCRPPGNRPPTPDEVATCKPFLLREIAVARPEVIVVLGNTAMKNLLEIKDGITRVRGRFQDYKGIKVMPTFHPAYLLRDPSKKRETWDDLKKVRDYLEDSVSNSQ